MLSTLDLSLIFGYQALAFGYGVYSSRVAGKSLESYFAAERSLPWWWLGTSMVATTFASDTPLVITGFVADHGISGNWFWWSVAVGLVLLAVLFARGWRASLVLTDAELIEKRYAGRPAALLRGFKALFSSLVANCIVLGWVFAAMAKITRPFLSWEELLGEARFAELSARWPDLLTFQSLDNTLTILCLLVVVVAYSSAGGIRGVIATDLLQFGIAMTAALLFAYFAVDSVGGLEGLWSELGRRYPENAAERPEGVPAASEIVAFFPDWTEGAAMSLGVFLTSIGVLWWANSQVDASGYLAQRLNTARSERDAEQGALWFVFVNFAVRTWPWVLVGLVALVVYPLGDPGTGPAARAVAEDREMAYPLLMQRVLPSGVLGLTLLSLIAAFMSTVDTHINWGASYLSNDIYRRFLRPGASNEELVVASRVSVVVISIMAVFVAAQVESVGDMWKFSFAMLSGLGVPHMLRWLWWRANAWTEISGMATGLLLAVIAYGAGWAEGVPAEYVIFCVAGTSSVVAVLVTLLTPPVPSEHLHRFAQLVRPVGAWRHFSPASLRELHLRLGAWGAGVVFVFGCLFGVGKLLLLDFSSGGVLLAVGAASGEATRRLLQAASELSDASALC